MYVFCLRLIFLPWTTTLARHVKISEIRSLVTIFLFLWRRPIHRTNNMQTPCCCQSSSDPLSCGGWHQDVGSRSCGSWWLRPQSLIQSNIILESTSVSQQFLKQSQLLFYYLVSLGTCAAFLSMCSKSVFSPFKGWKSPHSETDGSHLDFLTSVVFF